MEAALYIGDICSAPVEVVCTSTNPHLELILGTGGAVRDQGGHSIQQECLAIITEQRARYGRAWIPPGSAVRTSAGKLPYRFIVHCIAIDAFHDSSEETIRSCVREALQICATAEPPATSVAMPVLASGHGHVEFESSLHIMADELISSHSPLREVVFVVYEPRHVPKATALLEDVFGTCQIRTPM